ncbi:MAG: oligosaccharide flippase family protein, partial [Bacteroidota bacterium]
MKKFLSDTLFITAGGLINRVKGLVFIPLIIAAVGMDSYGAFVQILNNIRLAKPFASIGLGMGFQRFASSIDKKEKRLLSQHFFSVFAATVAFGLIGVLVLFVLSSYLSLWFFEGKFLAAVQVSSLAVLSNTMYSNISKFMLARKNFKLYSVLTLIYELSPYVAFVIGILVKGEIFWGIVSYVITDLVTVLIMLGFIVKDLKLVMPKKALFLQYFHFSYPLAIAEVEGGLLDKVDRYFISGFLGLEAVGIYNIIYRVCSIIDFITTPIRKQMMSYLPKVWDKGFHQEAISTIRNSLLLFLLITTGMLVCFTLYFDKILFVLAQKTIELPNLEVIVLLIGLGIIASAAKRFYYLLIKLKNKSMDQLWYQLIGLVPNVILNYLLIPQYGLLGAAMATFVSYILIIAVINFRHKLNLDGQFF